MAAPSPLPLSLVRPGAAQSQGDTDLHNMATISPGNVVRHIWVEWPAHIASNLNYFCAEAWYSGSDSLGKASMHS